MSAIPPFIDNPYPNIAAEQAAQPYATPPIEDVTTIARSAAAESPEQQRPGNSSADSAALSLTARDLAQKALENMRAGMTNETFLLSPRQVLDLPPAATRDNIALRQLIRSFFNYDNRAAVERFNARLGIFTRYQGQYSMADQLEAVGVPPPVPTESDTTVAPPVTPDALAEKAVLEYHSRENTLYDYLHLSRSDYNARARREAIAGEMARWYAGQNVFNPNFLYNTDPDGFRLTPVTAPAQEATRASDVLASYDRSRIAQYLREIAALTPNDFMFYDPTYLENLTLEARRLFLARIQAILDQNATDARAAELRYAFDQQGQLILDLMGLQLEQDRLAIERAYIDINTYYGELRQSVQQYDGGIISAIME